MSAGLDLAAAEWIKSSYSDASGGQCIEFARDFTWIKSSYSGGDGGQCLEFSPDLTWAKSSYSDGDGGQCIEFSRDLAWVKSSYSDANGGECLEFSPALTEIHGVVPVRDSKDPDGPALVFPAGGWTSFVSAVKNGEFAA
ncbi:DUF397 domain-containing protein [Streptomyces kronopolitis]|nr:DUF397 domain-containing protein [Streptomyces kronopolitis]MCL6301084.1 DUF397 domain-containing protein [Streptomyces kronopolitis]